MIKIILKNNCKYRNPQALNIVLWYNKEKQWGENMITLCEKDGATILVIEDASYEEKLLIQKAKELLRTESEQSSAFQNIPRKSDSSASTLSEIKFGDLSHFGDIILWGVKDLKQKYRYQLRIIIYGLLSIFCFVSRMIGMGLIFLFLTAVYIFL